MIDPVFLARPEFARNRLLFCNPARREPARNDLTVRLSYDDGKTWPLARVLQSGPAAYSNLVVLPDMSLGCLYECGHEHAYEQITFARFTLDWLSHGADQLEKGG